MGVVVIPFMGHGGKAIVLVLSPNFYDMEVMQLEVFKKDAKNTGGKKKKKPTLKQIAYAAIILLIVMGVCAGLFDLYVRQNTTKVEFTEFQQMLKNKEVNVIYYDAKTESQIRFVTFEDSNVGLDDTVKDREKAAKQSAKYYSTNAPMYEDFYKDVLAENAVVVAKPYYMTKKYIILLPQILVFVIYGVLLYFLAYMYSPMLKGANTSLESSDKSVSFDDIIGLDETINEIKFIMRVIQNKELREKHNLKQPKGLLLSGPPGTGKTMIAKAISNELKMNFIYVDSSSLVEMFVGLGASRVRDVFKKAKRNKPCIIFFDELDSIGQQRGKADAASSETDQIINTLLQELDGFKSDSGIFVIGATNFGEKLDKALIRPGRFDRKLVINPPKDWQTRKLMFEHYLKDEDLSGVSLDIDAVAKQCSGFTGADIAQVVNEAKMIVVSNSLDCLTTEVFEEAIDKTWLKGNRTKYSSKEDARITAYHESGHALSTLLNGEKIARVSITPSTSGVGGMVVGLDSDEVYVTKEKLIHRIKIAYSGRIAEELVYGKDSVTTGAKADITMATQLLQSYVGEYGFDSEVGMVDSSVLSKMSLSETQVAERVKELSKSLYMEAYREIEENKNILCQMADFVFERETLDGAEITKYYNSLKENEDGEDQKDYTGRA